MSDQFFYDHLEVRPKQGEEPAKLLQLRGSFSLDMVLRTIKGEDGRMMVIMKDGHEEARDFEERKGNKTEIVRKRVWVQGEIVLTPKDAIRFEKAASCWEPEGESAQIDDAPEEITETEEVK